jgi:D-alanyl-D-alanine carboxypeptidase/D-alanyl-D-alanine-endopeptidase (penicillin-binding protein 4)
MLVVSVGVLFITAAALAQKAAIFHGVAFQSNDSVLVTDSSGKELFNWQADKLLVPASLTKLATAYVAVEKWGLDYRFSTDFYRVGDTLWVKGFGDPFLVSEELDLLVKALPLKLTQGIKSISIDNTYFNIKHVPGRSGVSDPYNAPLSAVSANFNTVNIGQVDGKLQSLEAQTPLTPTAVKMADTLVKKRERVNLANANNAQLNFAELLSIKLGKPALRISINQSLNGCFKLGYRHHNSRTLADVLRGTLEFSNNFMANQVFLKLGDNTADQMTFEHSANLMQQRLSRQYSWQGHAIVEGAGLSRKNALSANQIDQLLQSLSPHKTLLKSIKNKRGAQVYAKTGTLNGVRSYAGYITLAGQEVRFVFNFNRNVPYRYRDQILERLLRDLSR